MPADLPLRDIHLPEAISWWPPAIGWWLLAVLLPLALYALYRLVRRLTRKTALKTAKKCLRALRDQADLSAQQKMIALSQLMRRAAISLYPRAEVASLTGQAWLSFLDSHLPTAHFNGAIGQLLTEAPYRPSIAELELQALFNACQTWLDAQKESRS